MESYKVRINRISVNYIKCVKSGDIFFNATEALQNEKSSIMGIYGQNGSGKTVVIEVIAMLKAILSGTQISDRYLETISFGEKSGVLEIEFSVANNDHTDCAVVYRCESEQRKNPNESMTTGNAAIVSAPNYIIAVINESLKISGLICGVKYPLQFIAHTNELQQLIQPKSKCSLLFGNDEPTLKKLEQDKILALYGSRSFIFSNQAAEAIEANCDHDFGFILRVIRNFAIFRLFIVGGETQSKIPLPVNFVLENDEGGIHGLILFSLESKAFLPKSIFDVFISFMQPLNLVLSSMIPGLQIIYKSQKATLDEKDDRYEIELFSSRDSVNMIPLRHESLGIKKIISFLSLLIATYNDPRFVLVVDEFDSSVFEFLLGEMISVMKASGRGQFIFTSHNLRPLEKLDDASICFTTTDSNNRYVKLKKKASNNLRDMYFRELSLGSNEYELYSSESKNALAFAFRQAGWSE